MASIEKRGSNSFRLVVETGYDANGKRLRKYKTIRIEDHKLLKTKENCRNTFQINSINSRWKSILENISNQKN